MVYFLKSIVNLIFVLAELEPVILTELRTCMEQSGMYNKLRTGSALKVVTISISASSLLLTKYMQFKMTRDVLYSSSSRYGETEERISRCS